MLNSTIHVKHVPGPGFKAKILKPKKLVTDRERLQVTLSSHTLSVSRCPSGTFY